MLHVAVALPVGHASHELPHESVEVSDRHSLLQRWCPVKQVKSQLAPLQLGVAWSGVGPQAAQWPAHEIAPTLQTTPQPPPLEQVARPSGSPSHGVHALLPQLPGAAFETHF